MVVEVADHPLILIGHFEVCLPQVVTMRALESTFTPNPSRVRNGVVQACFHEDLVDGCVTDCDLLRVVTEVAFYSAWSPTSGLSQLDDEFYCRLRGSMDYVRPVGFDV